MSKYFEAMNIANVINTNFVNYDDYQEYDPGYIEVEGFIGLDHIEYGKDDISKEEQRLCVGSERLSRDKYDGTWGCVDFEIDHREGYITGLQHSLDLVWIGEKIETYFKFRDKKWSAIRLAGLLNDFYDDSNWYWRNLNEQRFVEDDIEKAKIVLKTWKTKESEAGKNARLIRREFRKNYKMSIEGLGRSIECSKTKFKAIGY